MLHDLFLERFGAEADGPIKSFALRGIKDSPPYLHDGRLLTLEDTVEFFNLVAGLQLNRDEKSAQVAQVEPDAKRGRQGERGEEDEAELEGGHGRGAAVRKCRPHK